MGDIRLTTKPRWLKSIHIDSQTRIPFHILRSKSDSLPLSFSFYFDLTLRSELLVQQIEQDRRDVLTVPNPYFGVREAILQSADQKRRQISGVASRIFKRYILFSTQMS